MDTPVPDLGSEHAAATVVSAVMGQITVLLVASQTMEYALLRPDSR